ncbi:hypothetical protein [Streptomyces afghaniensis]
MVRVDYATQRRTPKDSYHWYRSLIAARRRTARVRRWSGSAGRGS